MATTTTDIAPIPVDEETKEKPSKLWHLPADDEQADLCDAGLPWITLCGEHRPPATRSRWFWEIAAMERCVVCEELR